MTERLTPQERSHREYHRSAVVDGRRKEYEVSTSERLLEEICKSFGTELLPAELNSAGLVRLSRPVALTHSLTGDRKMFQAQWTRFSPFFYDLNTLIAIYRENADNVGRKSDEFLRKEMFERIKEQNKGTENIVYFKSVTDNTHIPDVHVKTWRKGIYFAISDLGEDEDMSRVKPFFVHDRYTWGETGNKTPSVHIVFSIGPEFFSNGYRAEESDRNDQLYIDFPKQFKAHEEALSMGIKLHPSSAALEMPKPVCIEIPKSKPRELTMGLIHAYLRNTLTGHTLH